MPLGAAFFPNPVCTRRFDGPLRRSESVQWIELCSMFAVRCFAQRLWDISIAESDGHFY